MTEFDGKRFAIALAEARGESLPSALNLDWTRWRAEHPYEAHPRVVALRTATMGHTDRAHAYITSAMGRGPGGPPAIDHQAALRSAHQSVSDMRGAIREGDYGDAAGHAGRAEEALTKAARTATKDNKLDISRAASAVGNTRSSMTELNRAERAQQDAGDQATKEHGKFLAKLASSRPSDSNGFKDIPHPSGNGAVVRLFGGSQEQGVQDSKGMFEYHPSLDSAAKAAAANDAFRGTPRARFSQPFDYGKFMLCLDQYADVDPDYETPPQQAVLESILQDAQSHLDRLQRAGQVAPETLKAAQLAVQDAQQRLDEYKRTNGIAGPAVNDDI